MSPYYPEKPIKYYVTLIVDELIEGDHEHDAQHIVERIMSIIPATKTGSTHNRSIAAAAVWITSRICHNYQKDDFPRWTQLEISKAAGVAEMTIRAVVKRQFRKND